MNLFETVRRKDKNVVTSGEVVLAEGAVAGERWRGINISGGSNLRILDARRFYSLRGQPDTCGWRIAVPKGLSFEIAFENPQTGQILSRWSQGPTTTPETVRLPWPKMPWAGFDLVLSIKGDPSQHVFLAVCRALSRDWLYQAATGTGIEIGPGPVPQILPKPDVQVSYLEQMPPEEWDRLYNTGDKFPRRPELWSNYVVGDAHNLPVPDNSIDFIFGSHVFEHLANPLGHLERWRRKLRPGGKVLCVIPDLNGTKDALQTPTGPVDWLAEYHAEQWEPTPEQYARYFRKPLESPEVQKALADRFSIHVHFYTNTNCQQLLTYACEQFGYTSFDMEWTPNSKDFHFMLRA